MGKRKSKHKQKAEPSAGTAAKSTQLVTVDEAFERGDYAAVIAMRDQILGNDEDHLTKEVRASYGSLELDPGVIKLSAGLLVMYAIGWVVAFL